MKVIVKESGFYGGTWQEASDKPVEIEGAIAQAFLPPRGHQLALSVPAKEPTKTKG